MVAERVLTQRELNRAVLARQLLLERSSLTIPQALERIGGIQDQYAPNAYIRLWSCLEGFQRDDLTRALERRSVIQATLMRATIHVVSKRDYWPYAAAVREPTREWLTRVRKLRGQERELRRIARRLSAALAAGPMRDRELDALTDRRWHDVGPWLELIRVPPSGTWESRRANLFQTAERWVGPEDVDPAAALDQLVRRYLAAYGPASRGDIASWAGMRLGHVAPALARLRLRTFRSESGEELLDLPRAPLPDPETRAPVRFLPTWDAILLVHARRTGVLPERYRSLIFPTTMPQSTGTFLVNGVVAGTWKQVAGRIEWSAFERLDRSAAREVAAEASRLAAFHAEPSSGSLRTRPEAGSARREARSGGRPRYDEEGGHARGNVVSSRAQKR